MLPTSDLIGYSEEWARRPVLVGPEIESPGTSSIMIGFGAMKHPKSISSTGQGDRFLTFWFFIRMGVTPTLVYLVALPSAGLLITAVYGPASLLIPSLRVDFMLLCRIIGFFTVLLVFASWVGALIVGCLIMVPVWIWRFGERLAQTRMKGTMPKDRLWDQWMDGPEPS